MSSDLSPKEPLKQSLRRLMKIYGLRPQKHLGQNFLIDGEVLNQMISAADLQKSDLVLEIGAGLGALTRALSERVKRVVALEKDPLLVELLKKELSSCSNIEILAEDARDFIASRGFLWEEHKVAANLPYYLTSPLLLGLINLPHPPKMILVMVQREVAERVCARPPQSNRLAIICQLRARCQIVHFVSADSFWPEPKVESAILKIDQIKTEPTDLSLIKLINAGFGSPRKTLANNLKNFWSLDFFEKSGLPPKIRAEALTIDDWLNLLSYFIKQESTL